MYPSQFEAALLKQKKMGILIMAQSQPQCQLEASVTVMREFLCSELRQKAKS